METIDDVCTTRNRSACAPAPDGHSPAAWGPASARLRGLTLVELLVVVAIGAILAAIAVPSLQATMEKNQLDTVSNQVVAAFAMARSEAVRAPDATLLISNFNGAVADWGGGWTTRSTAPGGAINKLQEPRVLPGRLTMYGNAQAALGVFGFDAMGRLVSGAGPAQPLVFVICSGTSLANHSRAVVVTPSGRASVAPIGTTGANAGIPLDNTNNPVASCTAP